MPFLYTFAACLIAYLVGSVPFGLLLGFLRGTDIRRHGSGNIGATNLARTLGARWGAAAFVLDFAKGLGPTLAAVWLVGSNSERFWLGASGWVPVLVGIAAFSGHVFPIYLRFRGGKGVATAFGVVAALAWLPTAIAAAIWVLLFALTRTVSIASIVGAGFHPIAVALLRPGDDVGVYVPIQVASVVAALLIVVRHRANIARLIAGTESSFRRGRSTSESPPKSGDDSDAEGAEKTK